MTNRNVSGRPRIFTPQVFSRILGLVDQGLGAPEIADTIGCNLGSLRVRCSQQGISLRRHSRPRVASQSKPQGQLTICLRGSAAVHLYQQASKRGISASRFAVALLEAIVQDNLYDAVIDDDTAGGRATTGDISGGQPKIKSYQPDHAA